MSVAEVERVVSVETEVMGTFGLATATLNNSLPGLSSLYQQGGQRSMQFALKLIF